MEGANREQINTRFYGLLSLFEIGAIDLFVAKILNDEPLESWEIEYLEIIFKKLNKKEDQKKLEPREYLEIILKMKLENELDPLERKFLKK
jgi:hypothetical protein